MIRAEFLVPLAVAVALSTQSLAEEGDAARGAELFALRCSECHAIGETPGKKAGPNLKGVINRMSGTLEGYEYSEAMKGAGLLWSAETLARYLLAPRKVVPGTKMNFNGLKRPGEKEDIVAYLLQAGQ